MICYTNKFIHIVNKNNDALINSNKPEEYAKLELSEHWMDLVNDLPYNHYKNVHFGEVSNFLKENDEVVDLYDQESSKDMRLNGPCTETLKKSQSSKSENVGLRKDVVNKAIARAFNKFYNDLFQYKISYRRKSKEAIYTKFINHVTEVFESHPIKLYSENLASNRGKRD